MKFTSTLIKKFIFCLPARKALIAISVSLLFLLNFNYVKAEELDSANAKKPVIITNLEQCGIPLSMITRIKHLSPVEMKDLNEEYQHTDQTEDGREIVTIVRMRFVDNHITGYVKEALLNNSDKFQSINYIDIPVEWMCIPPKQDHPFHFTSDISELDRIKEENGCLDWVQRDNEVAIKFAEQKKEKKKNRSAKNSPKTK